MPRFSTHCPCQLRVVLSASGAVSASTEPSLTGAAIAGGIIFGAGFFTWLLWFLYYSRASCTRTTSSLTNRCVPWYHRLRAYLWSYLFAPPRRDRNTHARPCHHRSSPAATIRGQRGTFDPPPPPYDGIRPPPYESIFLQDIVLQEPLAVVIRDTRGAELQLHGAPGPLLNVSSAPRVALAVACSGDAGGGEATSTSLPLSVVIG